MESGTTDDHTGPASARGPESAAVFAGERATSLRAMFPAGVRGLNPATGPSPVPGKTAPAKAAPGKATPAKAAPGKATPGTATPGTATPGTATPPENTAAPARPRRRRRIAAIVGGLVLSAAAGIVAVQSTGRQAETPGQPLAEPPGPAVALIPAPAATGAPAASAKSAGSTPRSASASASRTAKRTTPVRSKTTLPATAAATTAGAATSDGPITGYAACTNASAALFTVTFAEPFDWHHVFINSDANTATGYRVPGVRGGLGADLMVENDTLYRSTGAGWEWKPVGGESPLLSHAGGTYHWRVPLTVVGARAAALPVVFNGSSTGDEANSPVLTTGRC